MNPCCQEMLEKIEDWITKRINMLIEDRNKILEEEYTHYFDAGLYELRTFRDCFLKKIKK